jgi:hypothetical protein
MLAKFCTAGQLQFGGMSSNGTKTNAFHVSTEELLSDFGFATIYSLLRHAMVGDEWLFFLFFFFFALVCLHAMPLSVPSTHACCSQEHTSTTQAVLPVPS